MFSNHLPRCSLLCLRHHHHQRHRRRCGRLVHHLPFSSASAAMGYRGSGSAIPITAASAPLCTTEVLLLTVRLAHAVAGASLYECGVVPFSGHSLEDPLYGVFLGPLPNGMGRHGTGRAERPVSRLTQSQVLGAHKGWLDAPNRLIVGVLSTAAAWQQIVAHCRCAIRAPAVPPADDISRDAACITQAPKHRTLTSRRPCCFSQAGFAASLTVSQLGCAKDCSVPFWSAVTSRGIPSFLAVSPSLSLSPRPSPPAIVFSTSHSLTRLSLVLSGAQSFSTAGMAKV